MQTVLCVWSLVVCFSSKHLLAYLLCAEPQRPREQVLAVQRERAARKTDRLGAETDWLLLRSLVLPPPALAGDSMGFLFIRHRAPCQRWGEELQYQEAAQVSLITNLLSGADQAPPEVALA